MKKENINKSIDEMNKSLEVVLDKIKERWSGKEDKEEYFKEKSKKRRFLTLQINKSIC